MKGESRITVPLFHVVFDSEVNGRYKLGESITLAQLDEQEAGRVQGTHAGAMGYQNDNISRAARLRAPSHRIEIFRDLTRGESGIQDSVHDEVTHTLALLSVASRTVPVWYSEPLDQWSDDRKQWERISISYRQGGARVGGRIGNPVIAKYLPATIGPAWYVPGTCVKAWGGLIELWRTLPRKSPLILAVQYFHDAMIQLVSDTWRSFVSASVCLECMFGDNAVELSFRISQRVANLARVLGLPAEQTYQKVRKAYAARSKLVHEGKHPDIESVVEFIELLRCLLPAMAALDSLSGGHNISLAKIDALALGDEVVLNEMREKYADWSLPEVRGGWLDSPKELRNVVIDLFPDFNIPRID